MNREVYVQFWESAGLRCPALLAYLNAYVTCAEANGGSGAWPDFYKEERQQPEPRLSHAAANYGEGLRVRGRSASLHPLLEQVVKRENARLRHTHTHHSRQRI
jgi:hypothetical protein